MAKESLLKGIYSRTVPTSRLRTHLLAHGPENGVPVVFLHGNVSSARFWEETMLALPPRYRAIAPDLRGYGDTEAIALDAVRGLRDWSDDLWALSQALGLTTDGARCHLVGWSMGAGVAMQYAIDHPTDLASLTFIDPVSPYGFGGTKDVAGTPCYPDFAGSGGGTANPDFIRFLAAGERGSDNPNCPRSVLNAFYFKPPFRAAPEREEVVVSAMLSTRIGEGFYPGDMVPSPNWPGVAPGTKGINNAMSPRYCNLSGFAKIQPKPDVLWIRGGDDQIVSDTSLFDFGFLGQLGAVPGWPGTEIYPPQPMVGQTRALLEAYRREGGKWNEEVVAGAGHSPHIEKPEEFRKAFFAFLEGHG